MDDAELVGGALHDAPDPRLAAHQLADLLLTPLADSAAAAQVGLAPELVEVLRARLGDDPDRVTTACQQGAAWVLGRRSVAVQEPWDLVASLPAGTDLPTGLNRTTGETMVQLVVEAATTLRLATPFIDRPGMSFLCEPLAAATARGVGVEIDGLGLLGAGGLARRRASAGGVRRGRAEQRATMAVFVGMPGAPRSGRTELRLAAGLQFAAGLTGAAVRPFGPRAFGILAGVYGLGVIALWGARHGDFPGRTPHTARRRDG